MTRDEAATRFRELVASAEEPGGFLAGRTLNDNLRCAAYVGDDFDEARRDLLSAAGFEASRQIQRVEKALAAMHAAAPTRKAKRHETRALRDELAERQWTAQSIWRARDAFHRPGTIFGRYD